MKVTILLDVIRKGEAQFVINTLTKGKQPERDGFRIRRESVENGVPCLTSLDTAEAILRVIESMTFHTEAMKKVRRSKEVYNRMIKQEMMQVVSHKRNCTNIYELTFKASLFST